MPKIVLLALIIWVIYTLLKRAAAKSKAPPQDKSAEDIVQCAHCGVYSPKRGSYLIGQQYFCCEDHSKLAPTKDQ